MAVMHFESQEARLAYLKGDYKEIVPQKKEEKEIVPKKKTRKKKEKKDDIQAE